MTTVFKYLLIVSILVSFQGTVFSQVKVRATVSRDKILIGEPLSLTLETYLPLGLDVGFRGERVPKTSSTSRLGGRVRTRRKACA